MVPSGATTTSFGRCTSSPDASRSGRWAAMTLRAPPTPPGVPRVPVDLVRLADVEDPLPGDLGESQALRRRQPGQHGAGLRRPDPNQASARRPDPCRARSPAGPPVGSKPPSGRPIPGPTLPRSSPAAPSGSSGGKRPPRPRRVPRTARSWPCPVPTGSSQSMPLPPKSRASRSRNAPRATTPRTRRPPNRPT